MDKESTPKVVGGADFTRDHSQIIREVARNSTLPINKSKLTTGNGKGARFVVLACGAFSPVTYMHLRMFEQAKDFAITNKLNLIGGYFSPVSDAYKKQGLAEGKHRLKMTQLAVESSEWVEVDTWEAQQETYQTTIAVLDRINYALNGKDQKGDRIEVFLLCGADLLESMNKPGVWANEDIDDIMKSYGLMVLERVNMDIQTIINTHPILKHYKEKIYVVPQTITNDISSTKLRYNIANGLSIKYLCPDSVIEYIQQHHLYVNNKL